ncbi:hypothetical protein [Roseicitreum antarcticum]|uniref:Uncharacterized protein n=1 Tax=Roseicitreum antarcticum TaxID=564137 RepID=A0A1H2U7R0_9RHOB|nr:hypothetical protein [Roseicitreum antarcticum]SDW52205.1 hypothetical protein SAMN04488238_102305 [Roseicitreum antarcticum]
MATYWRGLGRNYTETTARWVLQEAAMRGLTLHDYVCGMCQLTDLGVTSENAVLTLKPLIPDAHLHYNEHGGSKEKFATWEAWFSKRLRNRITYFFHKHRPEGGVRRCWGEWPLPVPDRLRIAPVLLSAAE